ncbi:hypothetical protein [Lacticaseibacillus paracasei]|uniref:hypothetical protein n=1 Tax=Lacticaseibacillus paracasei TaxID=1597 RepID=UPI000A76DD24|nr:hypothetical protein [Lacticaseibacillus paracasei]
MVMMSDKKNEEKINVYRGNEIPQKTDLSVFRAEFGKYGCKLIPETTFKRGYNE